MADGDTTPIDDAAELRAEVAKLRADLTAAIEAARHANAAADAARELNRALLAERAGDSRADTSPPAMREPAADAIAAGELHLLRAKADHLDAILASRSWRLLRGPRAGYARIRSAGRRRHA